MGAAGEGVRAGTDEERGVVEGSGIDVPETRRAFRGRGCFGFGSRFGGGDAGSAVKVETGGGGVCVKATESRWSFEEGDVVWHGVGA